MSSNSFSSSNYSSGWWYRDYPQKTDLSVNVTNGVNNVIAGDEVTYTITIRNHSFRTVFGATLAEYIPSDFQDVKYFFGSTQLNIDSLEDLWIKVPAFGTISLEVQGTVAADAIGNFGYGVNVTAPSWKYYDKNPNNNFSFDKDTVISQADLAIAVTNNLTEVVAGEDILYTVTVSNEAGSNIYNAQIAEFLPDSLTNVAYFFGEVSEGGRLEISSFSDLNIDLSAGETLTYFVKGTLAVDATGELEYGAEIVLPEGAVDANVENNIAYDEGDGVDIDENGIDGDPILVPVNLAVEKVFDLSTVEALDSNGSGSANQFITTPSDQFTDTFVEYKLVITNNGEATAKNVLLTEDLTPKLPIGLEFDQFINLDGGIALDTDENINTIEVGFASVAAGESKAVTIRAKVDAVTAFEFSSILGNIDPLTDAVNADIPEYSNIALGGKFYLSPHLEKEAGSQIVNFKHLNIQNTAEVTSDSFELDISDNTVTSRLDVTTIALDGTLNNGNDVTIRSIERLDANGSEIAFTINPDPVITTGSGARLLQFQQSSPFGDFGFGLNTGGTVTFEIREVTGTAGADGLFGSSDDTGPGTLIDTIVVTDGSALDLNTADGAIAIDFELAAQYLDPSKTFRLRTTTNDLPAGIPTPAIFTNYFDNDGNSIPSNTVDTTTIPNSTLISVVIENFTSPGGTTGYPTYNDSDFLLSGDIDNDGVLDQFGASLTEFFWNKSDDAQYLADLAIWESLDAEVDGAETIIDFLFNQFLDSDVFSFENFDGENSSFTLENEVGEITTIAVIDGEVSPGGGEPSGTPDSVELIVNDHCVMSGDISYSSLEQALSALSFDEPVRVNLTFKDSNGDGKVKTFLRNLESGLNTEQNWFVGEINIDASVFNEVLLFGGGGRSNIDLSSMTINVDGEAAPDFVIAGKGSKDTITGSVLGELIKGNKGKDVLSGFEGDDHIIGDKGFDIINGGRGNDVLSGGGYYTGYSAAYYEFFERFQKDEFVFEGDFGHDVITDFGWFKDRLNFADFELTVSDFDTNGDRHINGHDQSAFVGISNGDLLFDLTSVGGGTVLLEDVRSIKVSTLIV